MILDKPAFRFVLLAMSLAALTCRAGTVGPEFTAAGTLVRELALRENGFLTGKKQTRSYSFTVVVSGSRWQLHVEIEGKPAVFYDYCDLGSDAVRLYYVRSIESWVKDQMLAGNKVSENTAVATIIDAQVPQISSNDELGPIWLAYASECFFAGWTNDAAVPTPASIFVGPSAMAGTVDRYRQPAKVDPPNSVPRIPREVAYLEPNLTNRYSGTFTNALFRIDAYTNIGGLAIPRDATFTIYYPWRDSGEKMSSLKEMVSYRLVTTSASLGAQLKNSGRPELPKKTYVSDLRFLNTTNAPVDRFYYYGKGRWYPDEEVRRLPDYKLALLKAREAAHLGLDPRRRMIVLVVFGLATLAPLVLLLLTRRRRHGAN